LNQLCYEAARAGNTAATEAVIESLRPRLVSMAKYYARCSQEDPDDLLQEAWLGLLEALKNLDVRIGCPEQYLIQRARWRLLDAIKHARVRRCTSLDSAGLEQWEEDTACDGAVETVLATAYVEQFTQELKSTQQAVLFCLLRGLTWRETGHALGCTSANIAYHVRQIRRHYEVWSNEVQLHTSAACPV